MKVSYYPGGSFGRMKEEKTEEYKWYLRKQDFGGDYEKIWIRLQEDLKISEMVSRHDGEKSILNWNTVYRKPDMMTPMFPLSYATGHAFIHIYTLSHAAHECLHVMHGKKKLICYLHFSISTVSLLCWRKIPQSCMSLFSLFLLVLVFFYENFKVLRRTCARKLYFENIFCPHGLKILHN